MDLSILSKDELEPAKKIIAKCAVDRIFFIEEVLGVKPDENGAGGIEAFQRRVLTDMDNGATRVSIRSCVGAGKTALVSWLGLHFLLFRDDVKVIVTSPSFSQLSDGLIPEMQKWVSRLPWWLQQQLDITSERIKRRPDSSTNFISYRTARKETPEAMQGIHATHVLLLVDEASAVPEVVFDAAAGTMSTRGAITVLISNPTRVTGLFYKTHRKLKSLWNTYKVTSFDSSRVDPEFIENMRLTYGEDSQQYKVRILAEFPEGNEDSVVPRAWVEEAIERDMLPPEGKCVWGLDPGRGTDPTGFCSVRGNRYIEELQELNYENSMMVVGWLKKKYDELPDNEKPVAIYVDVIGLGGPIMDRLDELGLPCVGVNVAELAAVSPRFPRLRAELWYSAREWFEQKDCKVSNNISEELLEKFVDEMCETRFKDHASGKIDVESKKDMRSRGQKSPNLADAFNLTRADQGAAVNGLVVGSDWQKPLNYRARGIA